MLSKKEKDAAYYAANRERVKARANAYYHDTKEARLAAQKKRYARKREEILATNKAWAADNREKMAEYHSAYVKRNRGKWSAQTAQYRAAKKHATPAWANTFFVQEAYALARLRHTVCGGEWHVDHLVPLQSDLVCGLHTESNLCVVRGRANRTKSNKHWPDMP